MAHGDVSPFRIACERTERTDRSRYCWSVDGRDNDHTVDSERFLCNSVLRLEDEHCCTGHKAGGSHTCSVIETPEEVDDSAHRLLIEAEKEGKGARDLEAKLTAEFQTELSNETDAALAAQERDAMDNAKNIMPDNKTDAEAAKELHALNRTEDVLTEHELASRISAKLKVRFSKELAEVKDRVAKYNEKKMKAEAAAEAAYDRKKYAEERYIHNAKVMLASWKRHVKVTQSLFKASHYQLGFCSSFRPGGVAESDVRHGAIRAQAGNPSETLTQELDAHDSQFAFSSKTFRMAQCDRRTVLAAMGMLVDKQLVTTQEALETPASPAPVAAASAVGGGSAADQTGASEAISMAAAAKLSASATAKAPVKSGASVTSVSVAISLFATTFGIYVKH